MYDEPSPDSILENMPCGYLSFTDDRLIVRANLTLRNMLGQDSSDLSGKSVETVLTLGSRIFFQTHIFPLLKISGHADEIYLSLQGKTGAELPVLANATRTPRSFGFVNEFVIMAMTRRSQYEDQILFAKRRIEDLNRVKEAAMAELEAVNLTLEQQQHVLQSQFSELSSHRDKLEYQALQRAADLTLAIEDLEGFTYAVAHNFRAPLRAIVSASRILLDETPEQLGVVQRSLLERQEYNSLKLSALIDDLLQFARLRRKTLTRTELNVTTLASEVVAELAGQKTNFIIQSDLVCRADSALLRIVLACRRKHPSGDG
jgi:sigma-B regulation protein RsbU (phosphoserine phosphatase)